MKYIFRGITIFEYIPEKRFDNVILHRHHDNNIIAFNYCQMIAEDYKLLSQFFDTVYKHLQGENVELKDIIVN